MNLEVAQKKALRDWYLSIGVFVVALGVLGWFIYSLVQDLH